MAEKFLNGPQIGTIVQKVGGETVPNGVGADLGIESHGCEVLGDLASN